MTHHDLENGQASSCLIKNSHSSCGNSRKSLTDWKQALHLIMSRAIRSCQNVFAMDKNRREGKSQQGYITKKGIFRLGSDLLMGASPTRTPRRRATSTSICSSDQKLWPEIPELGSIVTWRCGGRVLFFFYTQVPIDTGIPIAYLYRQMDACLQMSFDALSLGCATFLNTWTMDDSRMLLGPLRVSLFELNHT